MYQTFKIRNFRKLTDFEIRDLQLVNLISGPPGMGKTSFLEALYIQRSIHNKPRYQAPHILNLAHYHGEDILSLTDLFYKRNPEEEIEFLIEGVSLSQRTRLRYVNDLKELREVGTVFGRLPEEVIRINHYDLDDAARHETAYLAMVDGKVYLVAEPLDGHLPPPVYPEVDPNVVDFGRIQEQGKYDTLISFLREAYLPLTRLMILPHRGKPQLFAEIDLDEIRPFYTLGGSVLKFFRIAAGICLTPGGLVFFNDLERGLHHSLLPYVWKFIAVNVRESKTRVFITTQSYECIKQAHKVFSEGPSYDFRYYRFSYNKEGKICAIGYDEEVLEGALETGLEMR